MQIQFEWDDEKEKANTDEMAEKAYRPGRKIPLSVEPLTLFLSHESMEKARSFGEDYITILSGILDEAVNKQAAV